MNPCAMPNLSCKTFAMGARQLVVQLGVGNDHVFRRVEDVVVDTDTNRHVRIFAGALISTRFAPALLKCSSALSRLVKNPVDSSTTSMSSFFHGRFAGSRSFKILILWPRHDDVFVVVTDLAVEFAVHRVPFEQMGERMRVGEIVDREDLLDLFLRHGAKDVAPDAPETVDSVIGHRRKS